MSTTWPVCSGSLGSINGYCSCHFHLLLKLQAGAGHGRYIRRGSAVREEIQHLLRDALYLPEGRRLSDSLKRLTELSRGDCGPPLIQATLRQFLRNVSFFRSYLTHPHLALPCTTNAVESMCRLIREMLRSSRAGSNPASLVLWTTAFIRLRPTVSCNGC